MERLSAGDVRELGRCVGELYAHGDLEAFPHNVLDAVGRLVPADYLAFSEVNLARNRLVEVMTPAVPFHDKLLPALEAHMCQHALIKRYQRTRDGRAYKLSDFIPRAEFLRLGLYREVYRHYGVEDQMAIALPAPRQLMVTVVFSRPRRTFTERDRGVLNLLRPHLIQAYRNAEAVTELKADLALSRGALEASEAAVVALGPDGRIRTIATEARLWLEQAFPSWRRRRAHLPDELARWAQAQREGPSGDAPAPRQPFVVPLAAPFEGAALVVRLVDAPGGGGQFLLLRLQAGIDARPPADPRVASLPPRVRRVMQCLLAGCSEKQAAAQLRLTRDTVHEYVKMLYKGLEVTSRGELLARFVRQ